MHLCVIGAGYVGLVSGACLADFGHDVVCVDRDAARIDLLRRGGVPIFEPGLEALVAANVAAGRLSFDTDLAAHVARADVLMIAVGTPPRESDGRADLENVFQVAREIAPLIDKFTVIVTKSTVPIGTSDEVEKIVRDLRPDADVAFVSNPEFLREGAAIRDFKIPDRIIIGLDDERARRVMSEVYRPLYLNQGPLVFTSRRTAEMIKYAANAFLAMKITFINECADLCERVGADVQDVARGIGIDNRIGSKFLHAGPGFGGSCFPKDTLAFTQTARDAGSPVRLIETVVDVNTKRKRGMAERIVKALGGSVEGKRIAVLGLTFKPNTDDMREAPSLEIIPALQSGGATVVAYDPQGGRSARPLLPGVEFAPDMYACVTGADALVIINEWDMFRALDLPRVKSLMAAPNLIDLRNIYRPADLRDMGFAYTGIGRAPVA
jgi:UDPglucose 6-dehydrogenase